MSNTRYSCQIFIKLELSQEILKNLLKYQISRKSIHWELRCSVWMDRHDEANSFVLQFHEHT